jgi:hypothetical protein
MFRVKFVCIDSIQEEGETKVNSAIKLLEDDKASIIDVCFHPNRQFVMILYILD